MIRFIVPLFPGAAREFAPVAMTLGAVGIIYGAVMAFAQNDMKRLVAYTSVSHLGFVVLGVFSWNELALQGAVMTMLCHGISTGALFILTGAIQERIHTRELGRMGGLWAIAPRLSGAGLYFALASLGLPGLGDFIGEFLVLLGTYRAHPILAIVGRSACSLRPSMRCGSFSAHSTGPTRTHGRSPIWSPRRASSLALMAGSLLWLGLNPQPVLRTLVRRCMRWKLLFKAIGDL